VCSSRRGAPGNAVHFPSLAGDLAGIFVGFPKNRRKMAWRGRLRLGTKEETRFVVAGVVGGHRRLAGISGRLPPCSGLFLLSSLSLYFFFFLFGGRMKENKETKAFIAKVFYGAFSHSVSQYHVRTRPDNAFLSLLIHFTKEINLG
jgi:hypothetical protein